MLGTMYEKPSSSDDILVECQPTSSTRPSIPPNCTWSPSTKGCVTKIKIPPMQLLTSFWAAKPMAIPDTPPTARRPVMFTPKELKHQYAPNRYVAIDNALSMSALRAC